MRYNTWRRPHLGAAPQHLGASPSDPLQLPWLLPRKGPSPPEEVYLSSQAPLLTTDMDVVVRGLSFPWAPVKQSISLEGYSVSVLLYGAGATCKTHTLLGPDRGSALGGTAVRSGVQATE